jgi:hypothetical protein
MHSTFIALIATCLLLSAHSASAKCKVKAIFIEPLDEVPETAVLGVNQQFTDIDLPKRNLSDSVELNAGESPIIVLPSKPIGGKIPPGIPHFTIPATWSSCILLFFHDPHNKVFPAKVIPVNASSADFPLGDTLIFNVSEATVAARLGTEVMKILPGKSVAVKPPRRGSGSYLAAIDCFFPSDTEPTALCRSTWQHEAEARQILFICPQADEKIPRVWGILDRENTSDPTAP